MATTSHIIFGDYLNVTDEGSGVIRVDGCPPGGGGGIQFDTDNEGGYLQVVTNDSEPTHGRGLDLRDTTAGGIIIQEEGTGNLIIGLDTGASGDLSLYADSGDVNISSTGGLILLHNSSGGDGIVIDNDSTGNTELTTDGANVDIALLARGTSNRVHLAATGGMRFDISAASTSLRVYDSSSTQQIFRIDENGDIHIKTGKTVTADL